MKPLKPIISVMVLLVIASSSMGFAFAQFSGYLSVDFDKTTASVGDTVTMTVTASNEGLDSWCPVKIYAPIPSGMQYVSHIVPDKTLQNYDPSSGIWDVNRMRHDERGHLKTLIITLKVLPGAAGENIRGYTSFQTLMLEGTGEDLLSSGEVPNSRAATITIEPEDDEDEENEGGNGDGAGSGSGNGTGNGTGSGSGTGAGSGSSTGFDALTLSGMVKNSNLISNSSGLGEGPNSLDLQSGGGGGNGKTYEVFNSTLDSETDAKDLVYGFAALLLVALIFLGYLYGTKKKP